MGQHLSSSTNCFLQIFNLFSYIYLWFGLPSGPFKPSIISPAAVSSTEQMAASVFSVRGSKVRSWGRCSKQVRQQRTRLYIIWRCTVLLLCWHD
ncbi:hypothetical protein L6164_010120 [Bauhinia variegata]|uniref:Uncharacterized protein n=1 Tax=Bauhinia variegata TaxID=167791 RepID=A0ACB9PM46_BAUVA|nr:hypothetical protein L6164_010120 [Bauhinia variegata]